jgi:gluconate transporter
MLVLLWSVFLLLALIVWARLNAFIALLITALVAGLGSGLGPADTLKSVQNGIGSTLGSLAPVLGLGVMLGKILSSSGATRTITERLLVFFGVKRAKYVLVLTGFVVGMAMFYNAGFMVLLPLVFSMAARSGLPLVYLALAMASALSVTHGFLPPHPSPTALSRLFQADVRLVLLYGLAAAVPAIVLAGVIFPEYFRRVQYTTPAHVFPEPEMPARRQPALVESLLLAIQPVLWMGASAVAELSLPEGDFLRKMLAFCGDPTVSMLISVLAALLFLVRMRGQGLADVYHDMEQAVSSVAMILLIIAAGGAFKQVLTDAGIGQQVADAVKNAPISPLVLGWLIAALVRVSLGSATVAGLMAGGILAPVTAGGGISPELMVLSIGAGSLMFSHVNDTGFWMFKEYFGLTLRQTLLSWSIMETIVSVSGLGTVLLLDLLTN